MAIAELQHTTLIQMAHDFNLPIQSIESYLQDDRLNLVGYDEGNPYGIAYAVEGRVLYGLVHLLRPARILEIGTCHGASASWMALACLHNYYVHGDDGHITTIDINPDAGQHIPDDLRDLVSVLCLDANVPLPFDEPFDFIFEDGAHSEHQVHTIYSQLPRLLKPGGLIVSHDTAMDGVGEYIRRGMQKGGVQMDAVRFYVTPPSPCGMSLYRYEEQTYAVK